MDPFIFDCPLGDNPAFYTSDNPVQNHIIFGGNRPIGLFLGQDKSSLVEQFFIGDNGRVGGWMIEVFQ